MFKASHRLLGVVVASLLAVASCGGGTAANGDPDTTQRTTAATANTPPPTPSTTAMEDPTGIEAQISLHSAMRQLWFEHMQWTYATVDAFFHNQDGLQAQLDRLLANQADIGAAIVPFYGQEAGEQLTDLLTTHIEQAVPVLTAAHAGDTRGLETGLEDWYANAQEIADFVSAANPENWPQSATRPMLEGHIDTTVIYATDLLEGDYAGAIEHFDEASHHMTMLADTLAAGIIAQFPDQFGE